MNFQKFNGRTGLFENVRVDCVFAVVVYNALHTIKPEFAIEESKLHYGQFVIPAIVLLFDQTGKCYPYVSENLVLEKRAEKSTTVAKFVHVVTQKLTEQGIIVPILVSDAGHENPKLQGIEEVFQNEEECPTLLYCVMHLIPSFITSIVNVNNMIASGEIRFAFSSLINVELADELQSKVVKEFLAEILITNRLAQ